MILLDTHVLLWFLNDPSRLPGKVNTRIEDEETVFVSIASFWEMTIKSSLGKLTHTEPVPQITRDCRDLSITILPIRETIWKSCPASRGITAIPLTGC